MKLSKLYSSNSKRFQPIIFNDGLNVVYAAVTRPKESDKDSHNLGKTLLISLIDYGLLCSLKSGHFLYDFKDRFDGLEFFLELQLNSGGHATIRRPVNQSTKISLKLHESRDCDFSMAADAEWDELRLPLEKAKIKLGSILGLTALAPWEYRKGLSYCLRTQADYLDVFQVSRFAMGKHKDWKPFMAFLLGFPWEIIASKYDLDDAIKQKKSFKAEYSKQVSVDPAEYDRIKGTIEIKRAEIDGNKKRIDTFNFYENDLAINAGLVGDIEYQISDLNDRLYGIGLEVERIRGSLASTIKFDLKQVRGIFEEASIFFPDNLAKNYEELEAFHRKISEERNGRLGDRLKSLDVQRARYESDLARLNVERESILEVLQNRDTFAKFKLLQAEVIQQEAKVAHLQAELVNLDAMSRINREIQELEERVRGLTALVEEGVKAGSHMYASIRHKFNEIIHQVLDVSALLSTRVNAEGNLEFSAQLIRDEESKDVTAEGKGTSYKKMLCAAFDMAVLETYADRSFYRFVYHDGILEGFDNRKKARFLETVYRFCSDFKLQYILTVIDADLPRDSRDSKIPFPDGVVIRELHERGDGGRLFNMPKF